jgi:hypothetical protein
MTPLPKKPSGDSREARFCQWVWECARALQRGNLPGFVTLKRNRPARPTGDTREALWMQRLYDYIISLQPQESRGVLVSKTTRGASHRAAN